jgi:hypothetical protein
MRRRSWPDRIVCLNSYLNSITRALGEKAADGRPEIRASPAGRNTLIPGRLKDRPEIDAWRNLPGAQGAAVLIPGHQPGPVRDRLQGVIERSAAHPATVPPAPGRPASRAGRNWKAYRSRPGLLLDIRSRCSTR